jgi:endonuclease G
MMTNRHVAEIFAQGVGTNHLQFHSGQSAVVDFYRENGRTESDALTVESVVMIHPYWDMALLRVRGLPARRLPLALSIVDPAGMTDREVVVVGYPGYDPTGDDEFQRVQNRIFRGTYYVKRLQPGLLRVRQPVESYKRKVQAATHDSSTLGGNSGSAVLVLPQSAEEPVEVIGLHFAGAYLVANYAVPTADLSQDSRIVDAGVNFIGRSEPRGDFYGPYWREVDGL